MHRLPGGERSGVFAYVGELEEWLSNSQNAAGDGRILPEAPLVNGAHAGVTLETQDALLHEGMPASAADETESLEGSSVRADADAVDSRAAVPTAPTRRALWSGILVVLLVAALGAAALRMRASRGSLRSEEAVAPQTVHQPNREAHDLYLRGRYFFESRSEENLTRAVDLFTQSIVHDPNYAPAYAGLADSYLLLREYGHMPELEAYRRASSAAQRAIALDANLPEAHRALAFVLRYYNWDMDGADREFRRAIELNPRDSQAHHWYATSLLAAGKTKEALDEIDLARTLEPQSLSVLADRGLVLSDIDLNEARRALEDALAAAPDFPSIHSYLSTVALREGDYQAFLNHGLRAAQLNHNQALETMYAHGRTVLATHGSAVMIDKLATAAGHLADQQLMTAFFAAELFAAAHRPEMTMLYLHRSFDQHETAFLSARSDPSYHDLRTSPEFVRLVDQDDISTAPHQ